MRQSRQLRQIVTRWQQATRDEGDEEKSFELLASMLRKAGWRKNDD